MSHLKIAFLGLGAMGARMAARLVGAGHPVTVWNRSQPAADALAKQGAVAAPSPRAAVADADIVFSMLADDAAARKVWLDPQNGAVGGLRAGALAIESSTVSLDWVRELAAAVRVRGAAFLDAPVAGSRPQAEAGQLIFMLGGEAGDVARATPALAALGGAFHHLGPTGSGAAFKLAVNAYFAAQLASLAELMGFLAKAGIAPARTAEILPGFPVTSPALGNFARLMAAQNRTPLFSIDMLAKDLRYALAAATKTGAALPGVENSLRIFETAHAAKLGAENVAGLARLYA